MDNSNLDRVFTFACCDGDEIPELLFASIRGDENIYRPETLRPWATQWSGPW